MIFGERIKQARAIEGLTQKDLADKVGVSQSTIAHIETERSTVSTDLVEAIAKETNVRSSFFEQEPVEDIPLGSLAYRARKALKAGDRDKAHQYAKLYVEQIKEMATRLNLPPLILPAYQSDPTKAARIARISLGAKTDTPIPHLINLLERNGFVILALPLAIEKLDAFSSWVTVDVERPLVAVRSGQPGDKLRFSVAHELGHIVLHKYVHERPNHLEKEANQFAGEFLMPEHVMRELISGDFNLTRAARLKVRWGVSIQALVYRARELNIITDRRYRYLFEQIGRMGWRKREPQNLDLEVEKPRSFKRMVEHFYKPPYEVEGIAEAAHITYNRASSLISGYSNSLASPDIENTEEYVRPNIEIFPN